MTQNSISNSNRKIKIALFEYKQNPINTQLSSLEYLNSDPDYTLNIKKANIVLLSNRMSRIENIYSISFLYKKNKLNSEHVNFIKKCLSNKYKIFVFTSLENKDLHLFTLNNLAISDDKINLEKEGKLSNLKDKIDNISEEFIEEEEKQQENINNQTTSKTEEQEDVDNQATSKTEEQEEKSITEETKINKEEDKDSQKLINSQDSNASSNQLNNNNSIASNDSNITRNNAKDANRSIEPDSEYFTKLNNELSGIFIEIESIDSIPKGLSTFKVILKGTQVMIR